MEPDLSELTGSPENDRVMENFFSYLVLPLFVMLVFGVLWMKLMRWLENLFGRLTGWQGPSLIHPIWLPSVRVTVCITRHYAQIYTTH